MEKKSVGVMLSMLAGKIKETGTYEAAKACAKLGYKSLEISQVDMTPENVEGFRKACEDFGLEIAAISASLEPNLPGIPEQADTLTDMFDKIVQDCKTLNCHIVRVGMMPAVYLGSREKTLLFAKRMEAMAERLKEHGIDLYLHNHNADFIKYDGEYMLDIIKANTKLLGFELDLYWIQGGGENPVKIIREYEGRVRLLHLKDFRLCEVKLPEKINSPWDFYNAMSFDSLIQFAEVGEGNLPIKECIEAGIASGSEYFMVEQDLTYGRDPYESLKISRDNLVKMGFKEWFE